MILATFSSCYYCRWLLATDYVLFFPIEYRSGTSPKPGSNVLFPSGLPLASAGVGGLLLLLLLLLWMVFVFTTSLPWRAPPCCRPGSADFTVGAQVEEDDRIPIGASPLECSQSCTTCRYRWLSPFRTSQDLEAGCWKLKVYSSSVLLVFLVWLVVRFVPGLGRCLKCFGLVFEMLWCAPRAPKDDQLQPPTIGWTSCGLFAACLLRFSNSCGLHCIWPSILRSFASHRCWGTLHTNTKDVQRSVLSN